METETRKVSEVPESCLSGSEQALLLQQTWVQFLAPTSGDSQLPKLQLSGSDSLSVLWGICMHIPPPYT